MKNGGTAGAEMGRINRCTRQRCAVGRVEAWRDDPAEATLLAIEDKYRDDRAGFGRLDDAAKLSQNLTGRPVATISRMRFCPTRNPAAEAEMSASRDMAPPSA